MASKTKAELIQENRELQAKVRGFVVKQQRLDKQLKFLTSQNEDFKAMISERDACIEDYKTAFLEQDEVVILQKQQLADLEEELAEKDESLQILQDRIRKIQFDEEVITRQAKERAYQDYDKRLKQVNKSWNDEIDRLVEDNQKLSWIFDVLYQNAMAKLKEE